MNFPIYLLSTVLTFININCLCFLLVLVFLMTSGLFQHLSSWVEITFILFLVIVESDFAKYMGKFEDFVQGSIETSFGKISLGAGGKGYVESQSSFGNLRKQEIDLQQLMKDVKDRYASNMGVAMAKKDLVWNK